jgi:hypothetical protein
MIRPLYKAITRPAVSATARGACSMPKMLMPR